MTSITIPNSVTLIGDYAFAYSGLTSITIPNSVTSIGERAFIGCCDLLSLIIPSSVTSIGLEAFSECSGLTSIVVEKGNPYFDSRDNCNAIIETATNLLIVGCNNTIISNSITSIEEGAFVDCSSLTSIIIPSSVERIGTSAFSGCSGLTSIVVDSGNRVYDSRDNCNAIIETATNTIITGCKNSVIPESVTRIGEYAFQLCMGLTEIIVPNSIISIGVGAFAECAGLKEIIIPNSVIGIDKFAFYKCAGLTSLSIGNSVAVIGDYAFDDCSSLTEIVVDSNNYDYDSRDNCNAIVETATNRLIVGSNSTIIPNSVTSIGERAFSVRTGLTALSIPNSVMSIGDGAFGGCENIKDLCIEDSSRSLEISGNFSNGDSLESIYLGRNIETQYGRLGTVMVVFYNQTSLKNVTIGNSVTSIGEGAFSCCTGLTTLSIPNSVTSIGEGAFVSCTSLESVTIGNSVMNIGKSAFERCENLKELHFEDGPNDVFLVFGAFNECDNIESVYLGRNLMYDYRSPFSSKTSLKNVTIGNSVTSISPGVFFDCTSLTKLVIPNSVTSIGEGAFNNTGWYNNQPDGILYLDNCCIGYKGQLDRNIVLNEDTRLIADCAFDYCSLNSVAIPNSVTIIGEYAFRDTGLTSLTIPNSVTSIGKGAFSIPGAKLGQMVVEDGNRVYDSRNNCNAIIETATNCLIAGCKNTIIPNTVTGIGECAFERCYNLTEITIPNSVASIGEGAFYYTDLSCIKVLNPTPPVCDGEIFSDYDCLLEVPEGCLVAYQNADIWRNFYNIAEIAGVEEVQVDKHGVEEIERYDINGRRLTQPASGINIIKMSDGSTRKEVIK